MRILRTIQAAILFVVYLIIIFGTSVIVWLDRKLKSALSFPRNLAELAAQEKWCIEELIKNKVLPADAEVKLYKVTPLNQEVIFRSDAGVIEISYTSGGENKVLKCFAKFAPTMGTVWNKAIFNMQLNHLKESFFNEYFLQPDKEIPAPSVYISKVSLVTGHLCLVTELMDDCMEYLETIRTPISDEHLELVMEGMAALHARYWNDTSERMKKVIPIQNSTVYLFDLMVTFNWSKAARKILVQSWCRMNEFQTVLHGDARIGNMMFPKATGEGRFVMIDWQAVRKGRAAYDLAYFLVLSLISGHRIIAEQKAIDSYYRHLVAKGVTGYTKEELEEDYRHACLCVLLLLSLPMLSGEVSVEGRAAEIFVWGMGVWRERMEVKFKDFDYKWMAERYQLSEQESREAVAEMLKVIDDRLKRITAGMKTIPPPASGQQ